MDIKYEGVGLNVDYVKSLTLEQFLTDETMRVHFNESEEVMKGAYKLIVGEEKKPKKVATSNNKVSE